MGVSVFLSGNQQSELHRALLGAFTQPELDRLLSFRMDTVLAEVAVTQEATYSDVVFRLIRWAERQGRLVELFKAARSDNPKNPRLIEWDKQYLNRSDLQPVRVMERYVTSVKMLDPIPFTTGLLAQLSRVCRVELNGTAAGTGFLVGPNLVMTNYHVIEPVQKGLQSSDTLTVRFDYHRSVGGVEPGEGQVFSMASPDWLHDFSPYSESDKQVAPSISPDSDELDYALLRLDGLPGKQKIPGADGQSLTTRGWIDLPETGYDFAEHTPLFIIQHPKGEPLQLALEPDAILETNSNGTRVRYRTNTEKGSSGSPCFSEQWRLVALHHSGDPDYTSMHHPEYNQGIPILAILKLLEARGKKPAHA